MSNETKELIAELKRLVPSDGLVYRVREAHSTSLVRGIDDYAAEVCTSNIRDALDVLSAQKSFFDANLDTILSALEMVDAEPVAWAKSYRGELMDSWLALTEEDAGEREAFERLVEDFAQLSYEHGIGRPSVDLQNRHREAKEKLLAWQSRSALPVVEAENTVAIPAATLLFIRDLLVLEDCKEAHHQLYFAVPWQDPYKPWAEWEAKAPDYKLPDDCKPVEKLAVNLDAETWAKLHELNGDAWLDDGHRELVVDTMLNFALPEYQRRSVDGLFVDHPSFHASPQPAPVAGEVGIISETLQRLLVAQAAERRMNVELNQTDAYDSIRLADFMFDNGKEILAMIAAHGKES